MKEHLDQLLVRHVESESDPEGWRMRFWETLQKKAEGSREMRRLMKQFLERIMEETSSAYTKLIPADFDTLGIEKFGVSTNIPCGNVRLTDAGVLAVSIMPVPLLSSDREIYRKASLDVLLEPLEIFDRMQGEEVRKFHAPMGYEYGSAVITEALPKERAVEIVDALRQGAAAHDQEALLHTLHEIVLLVQSRTVSYRGGLDWGMRAQCESVNGGRLAGYCASGTGGQRIFILEEEKGKKTLEFPSQGVYSHELQRAFYDLFHDDPGYFGPDIRKEPRHERIGPTIGVRI